MEGDYQKKSFKGYLKVFYKGMNIVVFPSSHDVQGNINVAGLQSII